MKARLYSFLYSVFISMFEMPSETSCHPNRDSGKDGPSNPPKEKNKNSE